MVFESWPIFQVNLTTRIYFWSFWNQIGFVDRGCHFDMMDDGWWLRKEEQEQRRLATTTRPILCPYDVRTPLPSPSRCFIDRAPRPTSLGQERRDTWAPVAWHEWSTSLLEIHVISQLNPPFKILISCMTTPSLLKLPFFFLWICD